MNLTKKQTSTLAEIKEYRRLFEYRYVQNKYIHEETEARLDYLIKKYMPLDATGVLIEMIDTLQKDQDEHP